MDEPGNCEQHEKKVFAEPSIHEMAAEIFVIGNVDDMSNSEVRRIWRLQKPQRERLKEQLAESRKNRSSASTEKSE